MINRTQVINNHNEIITRCQDTAQTMSCYYLGDVAQKLIGNFKESYSSQANLCRQIQNDLPFKILFCPLYRSYNALLQANSNYSWKAANTTIDFGLELQIEKFYDPNGKLIVQVASKQSSDQQSSYKATYYLEPDGYTVAMANGTIVYPEGKVLETLSFECYCLD